MNILYFFNKSSLLGLAICTCSGLAGAQGFLDFNTPSVRDKAAVQSQEQSLHQPLRQNLAALEAGHFLLDNIQIRDERARTPDFEAMADADFYASTGAQVLEGKPSGGTLASVWNN